MRKSCFLFIVLWFFIFVFNGCGLIKGQKVSTGNKYKLTIRIDNLPEYTPDTSLFYLPGNFNGWNPETREFIFSKENGVYTIQFTGQPGDIIEFKVTWGSWENVEVDSEGKQIEESKVYF